MEDDVLTVTEKGRPLLRLVAAAFDNRSPDTEDRLSRAV